ncbi:unnamed protein product [Dicrocoelium dendriticum]|nr:unnamed protein product [Dicrocoelium dendriticum]
MTSWPSPRRQARFKRSRGASFVHEQNTREGDRKSSDPKCRRTNDYFCILQPLWTSLEVLLASNPLRSNDGSWAPACSYDRGSRTPVGICDSPTSDIPIHLF